MARWRIIGLLLTSMVTVGMVVAQDSVADLINSVPACSLSCVTDVVIAGNCSLTSVTGLSDCLCTSEPLQSQLSKCAQLSCPVANQIRAAEKRSELCAGYPRESRVYEVRMVAIMALVMATPVVMLRCVARYRTSGQLWGDDWVALVALTFLLAGASLELVSADKGFGLHFWDVNVANFRPLLQIFYALEILYTWTKNTAKVSILLLYRRVFPATWFRRAVNVLLVYTLALATVWTLVLAFQCTPVASIWDHSITGKCLNVNVIGYTGAIMSVVEDIAIILLPLPELRKLQISMTRKFGVGAMLAIASFAVVTSMIRLKFLIDFSKSFDASYDNVDAVKWSFIELTCTIICGSLPPLRPWLGSLIPFAGTMATHKKSKSTFDSKANTHLSQRGTEKKRSSLYVLTPMTPPPSWLGYRTDSPETGGKRTPTGVPGNSSERDLLANSDVHVTYDVQVSSSPRSRDDVDPAFSAAHSVQITGNRHRRDSYQVDIGSAR